MKGRKNNKKLRVLKGKRKIKVFKENYINILTGLYIGYWTALYVTLNEIITKKVNFCQGYTFILLSALVVLVPMFIYHKRLDKKVDIKLFNKGLFYNSKVGLVVIVLAESVLYMYS